MEESYCDSQVLHLQAPQLLSHTSCVLVSTFRFDGRTMVPGGSRKLEWMGWDEESWSLFTGACLAAKHHRISTLGERFSTWCHTSHQHNLGMQRLTFLSLSMATMRSRTSSHSPGTYSRVLNASVKIMARNGVKRCYRIPEIFSTNGHSGCCAVHKTWCVADAKLDIGITVMLSENGLMAFLGRLRTLFLFPVDGIGCWVLTG